MHRIFGLNNKTDARSVVKIRRHLTFLIKGCEQLTAGCLTARTGGYIRVRGLTGVTTMTAGSALLVKKVIMSTSIEFRQHNLVELFHLPNLMHNSLFINNMYVTLLSYC